MFRNPVVFRSQDTTLTNPVNQRHAISSTISWGISRPTFSRLCMFTQDSGG